MRPSKNIIFLVFLLLETTVSSSRERKAFSWNMYTKESRKQTLVCSTTLPPTDGGRRAEHQSTNSKMTQQAGQERVINGSTRYGATGRAKINTEGVDVAVGRRRDQTDALRGVTALVLVARQLRLDTLRNLDLEILCVRKIFHGPWPLGQ